MTPVYWRPQKVTGSTTLWIGLAAAFALLLIELAPQWTSPAHHEEKVVANQIAQRCRDRIHVARQEHGLKVNELFDPTGSGIIGSAMTSITSKPANLDSKQLSIHPQFPSAIVQMLRDAGVKNGETVAVGWTGSFPGLNVALATAMDAMDLKPVIIASVTASQYGANDPEFTWLDMESELRRAGLIRCQTLAATIGGAADVGSGMAADSKAAILTAIQRNNVPLLDAKRLSKSIERRMRFLRSQSAGNRIAAYVNVGGGVASSGGDDSVFAAGLNMSAPKRSFASTSQDQAPDCLMQRFSDGGTPVVHLNHPQTLAKQFRLSPNVETWRAAAVSAGPHGGANRFAAATAFIAICFVLQGVILKDTGSQWWNQVLCRLQGKTSLRLVGQTEGPQLMA